MKNLHQLTIKARLDSLSIVSRQSDLVKYVATLALFLCLSIVKVWATLYNLKGDCTDWNPSSMTVSAGGNYEYWGPTTEKNNSFYAKLIADNSEYGASCVINGFNSTDVETTIYDTVPLPSFLLIIFYFLRKQQHLQM